VESSKHILQTSSCHISTATLQNQNRLYFSRTSALVFCSSSQNRISSLNVSWMNISHENKRLSTWSNIGRLTHRKHWSWRCFHFIYHLVFHIFRHISNAPLISIAGKSYSSHVCLASFSKKLFYCFQQTGASQVFFQSYEVICLAISSATSYDACIGGNFLQIRFIASEEFSNSLWRDWNALYLNAVSISKVS